MTSPTSPTPPSDTLTHEAAVIRLYVSVWTRNAFGVEVDSRTQARVLDAVQRLVHAAKQAA